MQLKKFILLTIYIILTHSCRANAEPLPVTLEIVKPESALFEQVVEEVLALQSSLIIDHSKPIDQEFGLCENGFLTVRMSREDLVNRLSNDGKILTARFEGKLVGYLLLIDPQRFLDWIKKVECVAMHSGLSLEELGPFIQDNELKILTQIGIASSFARRGIGRQLVDYAKRLSPQGLITTILHKPLSNFASLAFFSKQGFIHIGTIYTFPIPPELIPHEVYIELWTSNPSL